MNPGMHICVELEFSRILMGAHEVCLYPASLPHAFHVGHAGGAVLRMLGFEERTSILFSADTAKIADRVAKAALIASGDTPENLCVAVSLALAGGAEEAPPIMECAVLAAQRQGWDWQRIRQTPALLLDRMSRCEVLGNDAGEWNRLVFPAPSPDLLTLIAGMVGQLQARLTGIETQSENRKDAPLPQMEAPQRPKFAFRLMPVVGVENEAAKPLQNESPHGCEYRLVAISPSRFDSVQPFSIVAAEAVVHGSALEAAGATSKVFHPVGGPLNSLEPLQIPYAKTATAASLPEGSDVARREGVPSTLGRKPAYPFRAEMLPVAASQANGTPWTPSRRDGVGNSLFSDSLQNSVTASANGYFSPFMPSPAHEALPLESLQQSSSWPQMETHERSCETVEAVTPSFSEWLEELALLLDAECDLRGIDQ